MRLCDLVNGSADFIGPGSVQTDKDKPATEEEQKNIGDKRSKEFAAASPLRSFQELFDESWDRRILKSLLAELKNADSIVTYFGCVAPSHRVLRADRPL